MRTRQALDQDMSDLDILYTIDYSAWAERHVQLLRAGRYSELDVEHLLEELSDMGKSEQRELENRLTILLAHLLKWEYPYRTLSERWREFKCDGWRATIIEQRNRLEKLLTQAPRLRARLPATIGEAYADAVGLASDETGLPSSTFPDQCPFSAEQLFDKNFYPAHPEEQAEAGHTEPWSVGKYRNPAPSSAIPDTRQRFSPCPSCIRNSSPTQTVSVCRFFCPSPNMRH
jgi:hypothetical protein